MTFQESLYQKRLFFDGALATQLQKQGLGPGEAPEGWNLSHPQAIVALHTQYLESGCTILKTNTFGANRLKLHTADRVREMVESGVRLAREAIRTSGREAFVALDIGPTGKLLEPFGDLPFEEAVGLFGEMIDAGAGGADLVLIETMSDTYEVKAAVIAAREHGTLPVVVTLTLDEDGRLLTGGDLETAVALLEGLGVDAIGLNCGSGPQQMKRLLPRLLAVSSLPVVINPNAGLPVVVDGQPQYTVSPEDFAADMAQLAAAGVSVLGGCCGTTPAHLRELVRRCADIPLLPVMPKKRTVVSSYATAVVFSDRPVLIGERLNPTGKARLKQALRERDMDYLCREGLSQVENGADILDVNVGLPGLDEAGLMEEAVRRLQSVLDRPLQIDTTDPAALERALRYYNGKPLVNSVNGKAESMKTVFPLVKKYGAAVVALTLDEEGIPATAEGRVAIARRIIETAASYGIEKKDILVDPLAMTISTGAHNARVALEALRVIRQTLGVHTVLGVSNISFGLPRREIINTAFFTLAMENGLSAGIVNPGSAAMMDAHRAFCALCGLDSGCAAYIAACAADAAAGKDAETGTAPQGEHPAGKTMSLKEAVCQGLKVQAAAIARERLPSTPPLTLIDEELIPALNTVGEGFENHTLFLPQLLMSAEAAGAAFDVLRAHMAAEGTAEKKKGKILLATVKGDIHDIGKNIVKVLLQSYGYEVIDLGKDVPPETVVQAAVKEGVRLVGLSALMTTTVCHMEETIRQLRACTDAKIMVGGAVLTKDYARQIGADFYAREAMNSVRYADEVFGESSGN